MSAQIQIQTIAGLKPIVTKIGAAVIQQNALNIGKTIDIARALNLQVYCYNMTNGGAPIDWNEAQLLLDFINALGTGATVDVIFDPAVTNLGADLQKIITFFGIDKNKGELVDSFETISTYDKPTYIQMGNDFMKAITGTGIIGCADAALAWKVARNDVARNEAVAAVPFNSGKVYWQGQPDRFIGTSDMNHNFTLVKTWIEQTIPFDATDTTNSNSFVEVMPNKKKSVLQHHWVDFDKTGTGTDYITGTPLSAWGMGKIANYILSNTDGFDRFIWMSNQNLSNGIIPNPNYYDLKRIAPLFRYKNSLVVNINGLTGLNARGFSNDKNSDGTIDYSLLVTNETGTTYTLQPNQIALVGGGKIQDGTITRDSGFGDRGWDSQVTNEIKDNQSDFEIKPYGTTVFKFKGKKAKVAGS